MPVITIEQPKSQAYGRTAFYFDQKKPRHVSKAGKREALKRLNTFQDANREARTRRSSVDSVHHLNQDRSNGSKDNLFVCTSNDQHTKIELQGIELFTTLFDMGKVGFDYLTKKYFIACDRLDKEIKNWVDNGSKRDWQIFSMPYKGEQ